MNKKSGFDFVEFAYNRLVANFHNNVTFRKIIPFREIYRICGLLFSLNKRQTRALLKDMSKKYDVEMNSHGLKIKNSTKV
jgi:hypothetical protein